MWLRDSANQLQSYVSLLKPPRTIASSSSSSVPSKDGTTTLSSPNRPSKLASLFRGAINLQARYLLASPHCNAFQPPPEAGMEPGNDGNRHDLVFPPYNHAVVFECKYELDSLAAFLQLSWDYYSRTKDARFFVDASGGSEPYAPRRAGSKKGGRRNRARRTNRGRGGADGWRDAVVKILNTAEEMRMATYTPNGKVPDSPYRFERFSSVPTETMANRGNGSPVKADTGLVRSAFRPSDDATTYQFLIPANMMLAKYLDLCSEIMAKVEKEEDRLMAVAEAQGYQGVLSQDDEGGEEQEEEEGSDETVTARMKRMSKEIKKGIEKYGKRKHPEFGDIYAYETDGFWSSSMMVSQETTKPPPPQKKNPLQRHCTLRQV